MEADEIIEKINSSYNFPVIVVKKKKNGEIRPAIDFRELNKIVIIEYFPSPRIDDFVV